MSEERKEKFLKNIEDAAKKLNYDVIDIDFNERSSDIFVTFINHNTDRSGKEFGECRLRYYDFLNGRKPKSVMYEYAGKTSEQWVEEAKKAHPEYDYSKTLYLDCHKSVKITCPKHGEFSVCPKVFVKSDYKCAKCKREESDKVNVKNFLMRVHKIYGNTYEYESIEKLPNLNKHRVNIICPTHGTVSVIPVNFLKGNGCPKCSKKNAGERKRIGFEEFSERATKKYNGKYSYIREKFRLNGDDAACVCKEHGEFKVNIGRHLSNCGCPKCYEENHLNSERFIERAKKIHGDKYDYSKVVYEKFTDKVCIVCPEHGEFFQTPKIHLNGFGCGKCSGSYLDTDFFIEKARKVHGDKYDYSKVVFKKNNIPVTIICPEHGEFNQTSGNHLNGRGCPLCKSSHLEEGLKLFLERNDIKYVYQFRKKELFDKQSIDFYLSEYDIYIYIECQGEQHFVSNFFKSKGIEYAEKHLEYIQSLDERKRKICEENGMRLIYFFDKKFKKYYSFGNEYFCDNDSLLNFLKNVGKK